jgi:hypothetical protein
MRPVQIYTLLHAGQSIQCLHYDCNPMCEGDGFGEFGADVWPYLIVTLSANAPAARCDVLKAKVPRHLECILQQ